MKITITGKPKEIAVLAVETQRRHWNECKSMMADRETESYEAMVKAFHVLNGLKLSDEAPRSPDSE